MSLFNSYYCPSCNKPFPLFMRPSFRINRGLLAPYLKCLGCGQISRAKINFISAVWIWPLSLCLFIVIIYILRTHLFYQLPLLLYTAVVGISLIPVFIGIRRGFKLVKVDDRDTKQSRPYKWLIPISGLALFSLAIGYYTRDWLNVVIGITIGLIVWALFYSFAGNQKGD